MKILSVYILIATILPWIARADLLEHEVYVGVAGPIECIISQDREITRVALLDTLAAEQREIHLIDEVGDVRKAVVANCEFKGSSYSCSWDKTRYLEISLDNVFTSNVNRMDPKPFLKGWLKSDIFRPSANVSCPVTVESRT